MYIVVALHHHPLRTCSPKAPEEEAAGKKKCPKKTVPDNALSMCCSEDLPAALSRSGIPKLKLCPIHRSARMAQGPRNYFCGGDPCGLVGLGAAYIYIYERHGKGG